MASVTMSYWYDSSNDEYEFPVYHLGDLSNYPNGSSNPHGVMCGMSAGYSYSFSFKSVEGGNTYPAAVELDDTIRSVLASYGRYGGTFYPSSNSISGSKYMHIYRAPSDADPWLTYDAHGGEFAGTNDRGGWTGTDISKIRTVFALATINGVERFGLYFTGSNLGPSPSDTWQGWCFCYQTMSNGAYNQMRELLKIDESQPNPYRGGKYSKPGGGQKHRQNWKDFSQTVTPDPMPDESQIGAVASGMIQIFTPSKSQINAIADVLWQKDFLSFFDSLVSNISELIISFGMVPFTITGGNTAYYTWFDYLPGSAGVPRGAAITLAPSQFYEFDMGTLNFDGTNNYLFATDSVLDYSPYSKLGIFLPFIGYQELDIDECREKAINLKYRIDILSGGVLAQIYIDGRCLYQFTGNCLVQLPITSQDCSQMISNTVNVGIAAASAGATGAIASAGNELANDKLMSSEGTAVDLSSAGVARAQNAARVSNSTGSLVSASANAMMGMKPNYKMSGAISGSTSLVGVKQPYLFLTTPRQSMPEGYEHVCGFPCNMGGVLGEFSGYTVVEDIRLNSLVATSPEVGEIYELLKAGVII